MLARVKLKSRVRTEKGLKGPRVIINDHIKSHCSLSALYQRLINQYLTHVPEENGNDFVDKGIIRGNSKRTKLAHCVSEDGFPLSAKRCARDFFPLSSEFSSAIN